MSFQQGLSGLNASSQALDVVGNNIANAGTVGFKSATPHFSDVYAASLSGGGASQVGIGATMSAVQQQFTQGNITTTNNPLDISINGGGFFRISENNAITYSRNGQFHLNNAGYIVNDREQRLTGYPVDTNGNVVASTPVDLQLSSAAIPPRATSDALSGNMTAVINLDSRETAPALAFNYANPLTYNFSTGMSVYDTLGVAHTLTTYYVKSATPGQWAAHATLDGATPVSLGNMTFSSSGALSSSATVAIPAGSFTLTTGATSPWSPGTINFAGTTQYGTDSGVTSLTQGGYTAGSLAGITVGSDGVIQGRYTNGQSRDLGQVVLANFRAPTGLVNLGNNQWAESSVSGPPLVGAPGSSSLGVLNSSSIEESNVDLTAQLVNMITQQRNYQASAQTIKTQDQVLQTLVNLR
ncbi:MAG: flagellar hook protein FlgE [Pseudomonadota bacterium]|nr:flagellar hook protein FlgE [Pseudomonadota bacterium]MDQ5914890.1 flagellar hook protein FlgE [Pseudomonadota bacterium]MDQ5946810.1 flagellar hook protein FlgE [Pseudomonadota bacterium]